MAVAPNMSSPPEQPALEGRAGFQAVDGNVACSIRSPKADVVPSFVRAAMGPAANSSIWYCAAGRCFCYVRYRVWVNS